MASQFVKRVAYVVKRYPRYSETFIVNEILAHEAAGLDVSIFALRPPVDTHFQDIIARVRAPVNYLPSGSVRLEDFWKGIEKASEIIPDIWERLSFAKGENHKNIFQAIMLAVNITESGIDHIHAHFVTSAASVARLAAHFAGIPYSVTAHAKDIFHESVDHDDVKNIVRDASTVITVSDYNVRFLQDKYNNNAGNVARIYNGLDLTRFSYSDPDKSNRHIAAVGRLIEKKGFMDLVNACDILAKKGVDFQCSIVGAGPLEEELRGRINELGLSECVFLPGPRPQREIIELVRNAAVFAGPCVVGGDGNQDGLPTVLLESMALGTATISTDVTGIPEIVKHNETGLMVPQHSPVRLAEALERILDDPTFAERLAKNARKLIEKNFDADTNAALIRDVFNTSVTNNGNKTVVGCC